MMSDKEVLSLIALLDDDDQEVVQHVEEKLLSLGPGVINILENEWGSIEDIRHQLKLENIIHKIQFEQELETLRQWSKSEEQDLLDGLYIIAKYRYPELTKQSIINEIDRIRLDVWLELRYDYGAYEKIRVMNHILYNVHGFKGNTDQYHDPQTHSLTMCLNRNAESDHVGCCLYVGCATIKPTHLRSKSPTAFCAWIKDVPNLASENLPFNVLLQQSSQQGKMLFYINAFNNGSVFSKTNLEQFLKQIQIEPRLEFFEACTNLDIIKRVLRNLAVAYEKINKPNKVHEIHQMLSVLGEPQLDSFEDITPDQEDED